MDNDHSRPVDAVVADSTFSGNTRPPWVLGKICRNWRSSALTLPRLWTTFKFDVSVFRIYREQVPELCSLQLTRCQDQLIKVVFGKFPQEEPALTEQVLSILCGDDRVTLWGSLTIIGDRETLRLLKPYSGSFRGLKELHLYALWQSGIHPDLIIDIFQNAPCLRTVSIWGRHEVTENLVVPWTQITHYTARATSARYMPIVFHYKILPKLENLQVCWLDSVVIPGSLPQTDLHLVIPLLHTLILNTDDEPDTYISSGVKAVLDYLSFPALRILKLRNGLHQSSHSLVQCISRSSCSLRELTLFDLDDTDRDDISHLLLEGSLSELQVLTIGDRRDWPYISTLEVQIRTLQLLQIFPDDDNGGIVLLPNLRCFQTAWHEDFRAELTSMVRSRCAAISGQIPVPPHSLTRLVLLQPIGSSLENSRSTISEMKERLQDVCAGGFELDWEEMVF
ncbi:hypothetical protein L218DRAFT_964243 [Marasmius fiardii PR-910]|nr:hypothetical protein L218DRAFT_964243 [Marasmius fiardii PR-910]